MSFLLRLRKSDRKSAKTANVRLKELLAYDRAGISPGKIEALKEDMIVLTSKYFDLLW